MTRLTIGALVTKCTAAVMSAFLFIAPMAWAQSNVAASAPLSARSTDAAKTDEGSSKGTLTFTDPSGKSTTAKAVEPVIPNEPATATTEAASDSRPDGVDAKPAELTGADAATDSPTALAQNLPSSTGGTTAKRLDPLYNQLPKTNGEIKVRRAFKLFAKEELIHNLSFRETPIKEVVAELARRGNLNIILDKSVFGKITGDLHDVTLNEALDAVLAAAGLQTRVLDSNTCIVATANSLGLLGLNRTHSKVFKLSYISPYECATDLMCSVFNTGYTTDFSESYKTRSSVALSETPKTITQGMDQSTSAGIGEGGAQRTKSTKEQTTNTINNSDQNEVGADYQFNTRLDSGRTVKGSTRVQQTEGTGFNNAAQDPGTEMIRGYQEVSADFIVDNNGGRTIVIPDARNRQVIVVGTPDDLALAEECIHLLDKRPELIHVQVSLVELDNSGIRSLGAALNLQGQGASGALLGGSGAPLINALPGLGSAGTTTALTNSGTVSATGNVGTTLTGQNFLPALSPTAALPTALLGSFMSTLTSTQAAQTPVTAPSANYTGLLGGFFPGAVPSTIAGLSSATSASSNLNFLALGKGAGGRTNIATMPMGVNLSLNLLLQQNKAKILANPSVIVSDNTEALVTLASEVIHKVTSTVSLGVTNVNVELTKAGIFLDVMPKCTEDGFISMRIRPQVSAPIGSPLTFANQQIVVTLLNIREILTQEIRVKNGQTLVLGGLFTEQEASQISKVPYLAETPLFGALFRSTLKGRQRTELMIMITPKIVEEQPSVPNLTENPPPANL